jgi:hypothetical protein
MQWLEAQSMTRKLAAAVAMALLFGFGDAMLTEATARQSHSGGGRAAAHSGGGHGGGGHASFAARSGGAQLAARANNYSGGGGAARFSASAAGFSFSARAGSAPAFVGVAPQRFSAHAGTGRVHHRHHGRGYGYVAAIGIPLVSYGYVSSSYHHCAWLKARYEDTGLRKWRQRYEACRDGDED